VDKETENFLYDLTYFQEVMHMVYSDAYEAYDALEQHDGENNYIISLGYLNMANQSFVELNRFKNEKALETYEISPFFNAYLEYKHELKEVITNKDTNTSWLYTKHQNLINSWKNADEFIKNYLKTTTNN